MVARRILRAWRKGRAVRVVAWFDGLALASGPVPTGALGLGAAALAFLLLRRSRRWWLFVLAAAAGSAAVAALAGWAVIHVWYWWAEDLPATVVVCTGLALWGLVLGLATAFRGLGGRPARTAGRRRLRRRPPQGRRVPLAGRLLAVAAATVIVAVSALQVNVYFGQYPTVGSLLHGEPALAQGIPHYLQKKRADRFGLLPARDGWVPPRRMPAAGEFRESAIPGTVSGFHARPAVVYLPPAYFTPHAPALPVVVLVSGQPGSPQNWLASGHLAQTLDAYSTAHRGLAPVVVMPDPNGSQEGNTMCMNSALAQADTYMAVDVPRWITATLNVDTNHEHWAVAGFSYGGTCALQMVTRHPDVYTSFAAISPEEEPALTASRAVTIQRAFHGNTAAFDALVPMTLLRSHRYPAIHGWFASGAQDTVYTRNAQVLEAAGRQSGMVVERTTFPGGHSWTMVTQALPAAFSFLGARLGLQ